MGRIKGCGSNDLSDGMTGDRPGRAIASNGDHKVDCDGTLTKRAEENRLCGAARFTPRDSPASFPALCVVLTYPRLESSWAPVAVKKMPLIKVRFTDSILVFSITYNGATAPTHL